MLWPNITPSYTCVVLAKFLCVVLATCEKKIHTR